ncbi:unnamed protein product [Rhizophagus irregularis]|nr:unnamed protein product [Rhizophagus irregularis]
MKPVELCHVCGRHGCSPSKCSPQLAKKTNDRLNKLYTRFNAGLSVGRSDSRQARSSSGSRSRSRSNSHSRGHRPSGPASSSHRQQTRPQNKDKAKDINRQDSSSNPGSTSPSSSQNKTSIPPDVIKEIREHIFDNSPNSCGPLMKELKLLNIPSLITVIV